MGLTRISLLIAIGSIAILPHGALGQSSALRTPWGSPDFNGIWNHGTATPLERPDHHAGRERLDDNEIAELNAQQRASDGALARRAVWWERGLSDGRTSIITEPRNGKLPYTDRARALSRSRPAPHSDGPEGRNLWERCLTAGIPRLGGVYSQNIHLAQTPNHVVFLHEMIHEYRIIPLDENHDLPRGFKQWLGHSRGHWDGDTLVIETTGFDARQLFRGLSLSSLHLVERLTRVDADTLRYDVSFIDPELWSQPWTASLMMPPSEGPMFEYACHEGNVGMTNILEFARRDETTNGREP